jgi:sugar phosphate isomerase/epimerase
MIKIGCASYSYRDYLKDGRMSYEDFIEESYRLGLDGVELTTYWFPSDEPSYLRKLKHLALRRGLPTSCVSIRTDFCNADAAQKELAIKNVEGGLTIARELGAPCLRVFSGKASEGETEAEATKRAVETLKLCAGYAGNKGVVMALENHHGITARADNVIKIINDVGSPWLRVNLDLGNYYESTYEEIAKTVPYTVNIHAKISCAQNKVDYRRIKEILETGGYNGFLSIEHEEKEDQKIGVARFAKFLLNLFR